MFESSFVIEKMVGFHCDEIKKKVEAERLKQKLGSPSLFSNMKNMVRAEKSRIRRKR